VAFNNFAMFFSILKDAAFDYEQEWRLIYSPNQDQKDICYQGTNGLLIPYMESKFSKTSLKKIIIGPSTNQKLSKQSITMLLKKTGYHLNSENVIESIVPYRII
jgi:hypothetical protein